MGGHSEKCLTTIFHINLRINFRCKCSVFNYDISSTLIPHKGVTVWKIKQLPVQVIIVGPYL